MVTVKDWRKSYHIKSVSCQFGTWACELLKVIDRIDKRIGGWQSKLLSPGGRLTSINLVLPTLLLYYLQSTEMGYSSCRILRQSFFQKGCSRTGGGASLKNWKNICKQKGRRTRDKKHGRYKYCAPDKVAVEILLQIKLVMDQVDQGALLY